MPRLFFTVFAWFWLTVVLAGALLAGTVYYNIQSYEAERRARASSLTPDAAKAAVETVESSGEAGLARYLKLLVARSFQTPYPIRGFLFRSGQRVITVMGSTDQTQQMAKVALESDGADGLVISGNFATQRVTGRSGHDYTLVLVFDESTASPGKSKKAFIVEMPVIILLASGLFCYFITRHVTSPLFRLRSAAHSISEGRLDTRVGPTLGRRRGEIAELGRDFDQMAERIESLVAARKRLLADVSHELRSPLSRLTVALGLIKQGPAEETTEHLERIALEVHRLDNLIGQLLTFSRVDSGTLASTPAAFDLTNLVHGVAGDADFEARSRSRRVIVTSADECTMTGSEELIRSALENIVRNAVRFTKEGTSVEITLKRQDDGAVRAILRVRDYGPGVPADMLREIFVPLRRVRTTPDQLGSPGASLGLAITDRAVKAHGGAVRAVNATDGGLIVEVVLPLGKE
jgi:two-component system sensor histidine kinase CpxA